MVRPMVGGVATFRNTYSMLANVSMKDAILSSSRPSLVAKPRGSLSRREILGALAALALLVSPVAAFRNTHGHETSTVNTTFTILENREVVHAPSEEPPRLLLDWYDGYRMCPVMRLIVAREIESFMDQLGVEVRWRTAVSEGTPAFLERGLRVVLLPQSLSPAQWGMGEHVMGAVMGDAVPRRVVYVFTPKVIQAVGTHPLPHSCLSPRQRNQLGRALARVILHEIVHAIVPTHPHAPEGIMNQRLTRSDLLQREVSLDEGCLQVFLAGLVAMETALWGDPQGH
ncbi:MAG: hypothetical protein ACE5JI_04885 [Acidobacteriota bacterium]